MRGEEAELLRLDWRWRRAGQRPPAREGLAREVPWRELRNSPCARARAHLPSLRPREVQAASAAIEAKASARRTVGPSDYHAQRVLYLTETARFDHLLTLLEGADLWEAVNKTMRAVEEHNPAGAVTAAVGGQQRTVSEGLSEPELAVFDLLTKPDPVLTEE